MVDWLIELSDSKLSNNKPSDSKLSENNLARKLVENMGVFFKPITYVIFVINLLTAKSLLGVLDIADGLF